METNDNVEELIKELDDDYFQCIKCKKYFLIKEDILILTFKICKKCAKEIITNTSKNRSESY